MRHIIAYIMDAEKRVWVATPKIEDSLYADSLVRKASKGLDVRIIANDTKDVVDAINRFIQDKERDVKDVEGQIKQTKRQLRKMYIEAGVIITITLIFLALAIYIEHAPENPLAKPIPLLGTFNIHAASLMVVLTFFFGSIYIPLFLAETIPETKWLKNLEDKLAKQLQIIEERKAALKRNLNVIKAPITDELFIVDNRAWTKNNDMFVEVDANEAERRFTELWMKHNAS